MTRPHSFLTGTPPQEVPQPHTVGIRDLLADIQPYTHDILSPVRVLVRHYASSNMVPATMNAAQEDRAVWDPIAYLESRGITYRPEGWDESRTEDKLAFCFCLLPGQIQTRELASRLVVVITSLPSRHL